MVWFSLSYFLFYGLYPSLIYKKVVKDGAKELQETYMRIYAFDYKKACCNQNDFEFVKLD